MHDRIAQLEHENGDLRARREHLERDLESRLQFQEQQDKEVETERAHLVDKVKTLETALAKLRQDNRVSSSLEQNALHIQQQALNHIHTVYTFSSF